MTAKQRAAIAAIDEVKDGMIVGLGTGSTADFFLIALSEALAQKRVQNIRGVPTSETTARRAAELQIPIIELDSSTKIDLTIDGADEVAPNRDLIKGLGGALLREKIVAQNSQRVVIIADSEKLVNKLGTKSPLPVEVVPFAHRSHGAYLESLGCKPTLRLDKSGQPFVTDSRNYIYDCRFTSIDMPAVIESAMAQRAGIVESGLFIGIADVVIVGYDDRIEKI